MDFLLVGIIISGVHVLLLILSIILLYRRSRKICDERKENVTLLAKAKRKEQRYNQAVEDFRANTGPEGEQLLLLAASQAAGASSSSPNSQKGDSDVDDNDQQINNRYNKISPNAAVSGNGSTRQRRRSSSGTYHPSPALRKRMIENQLYEAGYPEPLSPTTKRVLDESNHELKQPTSDRFAFALISLLPVDVYFSCLGMWMAFVLRNEFIFWVGCIPVLHFLVIIIASSSIAISLSSRI